MKKKIQLKHILFIILIVVIIIAGYAFYSGSLSTSSLGLGSGNLFSSFSSNDEVSDDFVNIEVLKILKRVENIKLDNTVFDNPAFVRLEDKSITLPVVENVGKDNIFAPLDGATLEFEDDSDFGSVDIDIVPDDN